MPERDVAFTFDPTPFTNGVNKANKSLMGFHGGLLKTGALAAVGGAAAGIAMAGVQGAIKGAQKVLGSFLKELPEVTQTFQLARQIFMRNFLFPIRKALMPFLQRVMDWVRDNRALFVKWGQIVVSVFKTVVGWVRRGIEFLQRMTQGLIQFVNRTFGLQIKKIGDLFNILQFKLVAIFTFIGQAVKPIFERMLQVAGEVGKFLIEPLKGFFEGLGGQLPGIKEDFEGLFNSLKQFFSTLKDLDDRTGAFTTTLKVLGALLGGAVRLSLLSAQGILRGIAFQIQKIPALIDIIAVKTKRENKRTEQDIARLSMAQLELMKIAESETEFYKEIGSKMADASRKAADTIVQTIEENPLMMERRARQRGEGPGFEDVRAQLEALPPDERRRVLLKLEEKGHDISQFGFNIDNINITVTEGDAEQAGKNFVTGMRDQYNEEFVNQGR